MQAISSPRLTSPGILFAAAHSAATAKHLLDYQVLSAKQFSARLNLPRSWVLDNANPALGKDSIPYFPLGKFKQFLWNSPDLIAWIERQIVYGDFSQARPSEPQADYEYLDSVQFAFRLNVSESWVRDQVRHRATEVIPHARFGKYIRFRIGGPELEFWAERRMLAGNNRVVSRAQVKETIQ
jgi:hypothetical protein